MSEGNRREPGDPLREGVRAVTGILGAFKDAVEQTLDELAAKGDISPERARETAREAMRRAQDSMEDVRGRLDFATRKELDELRAEVAALREQVERHASAGTHHTHASGSTGSGSPGSGSAGDVRQPGTGGTGTGAGGSGIGDGSPGL